MDPEQISPLYRRLATAGCSADGCDNNPIVIVMIHTDIGFVCAPFCLTHILSASNMVEKLAADTLTGQLQTGDGLIPPERKPKNGS